MSEESSTEVAEEPEGPAVDPGTIESDAVESDAGSEPEEDGRTRCSWARGRPQHYFFHDAEFGRLPDSDPPLFELVLLTCFWRDMPLGDALDQRTEIYEAFAEWDMKTVAEADDGALDDLAGRGGIFEDRERLGWIRDVARACAETAEEYKELRNYILALPSLASADKLEEAMSRFPGFTKDDAANLFVLTGAVENDPHERDCWIFRD